MIQTWVESLASAGAAGPSLSNSSSATSILNPQEKLVLPAQYFSSVGRALRLTVTGRLSNIVTTPGTLTLALKFGSTVVFTSGAMQMSATAHTTLPFYLQVILVCRAIGSTSTLIGQGSIVSACVDGTLLVPATAPAVGTAFDGSASQIVDLAATFSIADAGNLIQCEEFLLESLN